MRTRNWLDWILRRLDPVTVCGLVRVRAPAANDVCDAGPGLFFLLHSPPPPCGTGRRNSKVGCPDEDEDLSGGNPQRNNLNLEKRPSSG